MQRYMAKIKQTWIKWVLGIIGTFLGLLIVVQLVLSPSVFTKIVNKAADKYVNGEVNFGKASVNVFRHFPAISVKIEDFSISYPTERYDSLSALGMQGHLLNAGRGSSLDTLAYFKNFKAAINPWSLIAGKINIPFADLENARIFAHDYGEDNVNWDIFILGESTDSTEADSGSSLPDIEVGKLKFTGKPHIVYTANRDSVFALIALNKLDLACRIPSDRPLLSKISMDMDSLFVAGRNKRDTIAFGMDYLRINNHKSRTHLQTEAKALMAMRNNGRMQVPMDLAATVFMPKDSIPDIRLENLRAGIGPVTLQGHAEVRLHSDSTCINGQLGIIDCALEPLLQDYARNFISEAGKIRTDARINIIVEADGSFVPETGRYPVVNATVSLPDSKLEYTDFSEKLTVGLQADAKMEDDGRLSLRINKAKAGMNGLDFSAKADIPDLLASDPNINIDAKLHALLDSLVRFIPDSLNITAKGNIDGFVKGGIRMSQMDIYNFGNSRIEGNLNSKQLTISYPDEAINAHIENLAIKLAPENQKSKRTGKQRRMLALTGNIDTLGVSYQDALTIKGKKLKLSVKNSTEKKNADDTSKIFPLYATLRAEMLSMRDSDGTSLGLDNTSNIIGIFPSRENKKMPLLTVNSKNKHIYLNDKANRAILTDASMGAKAVRNTVRTSAKRKHRLDSLAKVYPGIPRDSLIRHAIAQRRQKGEYQIPSWMTEADFRKKDINISLDKSLAKYFREWNLDGNINVRTGVLMTPYFPLLNILRGFDVKFDNDRIAIDSLKIKSGKSDISAKGALTGLRRALLGRGMLNLKLNVNSEQINANELLKAYAAGSRFVPETAQNAENMSNSEFLKSVTSEAQKEEISEEDALSQIIVLPGNLKAELNLDAGNISYSDLMIDRMTSKIIVRERTAQLTETKAVTNMGEVSLDAFYASQTKKDLKAGFSLNLKDITAEKVISLIPQIDTIMPLLKSFEGKLNCEIAATSDLDTNMNIVMPSINGILRITGDDLSITNSPMFKTLAKKLMFRNKKEGHVEHMSVEALISDNKVEIFPFVINIDRYILAASGIQNLDMSFKYHLSVIKSPILFKIGINLEGKDFDHMKFKIGKAKYKNTKIPVFSSVINQSKINLVESIHNIFSKGVEAAIKENNSGELINSHKETINYQNAAEQDIEELSEEEQKRLEEQEKTIEEMDAKREQLLDSLKVRADSLGTSIDSLLARNDSLRVVLDSLTIKTDEE